ncbi:MAG: hypothetical protein R3324_18425, partial [Halobacteriales archaeon]|nr:hypothetical protein [Halobacteriales archaeon]
ISITAATLLFDVARADWPHCPWGQYDLSGVDYVRAGAVRGCGIAVEDWDPDGPERALESQRLKHNGYFADGTRELHLPEASLTETAAFSRGMPDGDVSLSVARLGLKFDGEARPADTGGETGTPAVAWELRDDFSLEASTSEGDLRVVGSLERGKPEGVIRFEHDGRDHLISIEVTFPPAGAGSELRRPTLAVLSVDGKEQARLPLSPASAAGVVMPHGDALLSVGGDYGADAQPLTLHFDKGALTNIADDHNLAYDIWQQIPTATAEPAALRESVGEGVAIDWLVSGWLASVEGDVCDLGIEVSLACPVVSRLKRAVTESWRSGQIELTDGLEHDISSGGLTSAAGLPAPDSEFSATGRVYAARRSGPWAPSEEV